MANKIKKEEAKISNDMLKEMYSKMYLIRIFEERCIKLYRSGDIRGYFHPSTGQEAVAVGVCSALRPNDKIISTHRGHGHCIAKGAEIDKMIAELLGKKTGYCRGMGGSMHIADVDKGNLGANGIVGGGIPLGVGSALADKLREEDKVTAIFFSDGASNNGVFAESLNLAAIWEVPSIFIIENNQYAVNIPIDQTSRDPNLYKRAEGYGVISSQVDGNDVLEVYAKTKEAVQLCASGKGPVVIECMTYRHQGHHVNDPGAYMPKDKMEYFKGEHDPLNIIRNHCLNQLKENDLKNIEDETQAVVEQAIEYGKKSPELDTEDFLQEVHRKYY